VNQPLADSITFPCIVRAVMFEVKRGWCIFNSIHFKQAGSILVIPSMSSFKQGVSILQRPIFVSV
jgi:metallophosphoesterase superfamily enzyme